MQPKPWPQLYHTKTAARQVDASMPRPKREGFLQFILPLLARPFLEHRVAVAAALAQLRRYVDLSCDAADSARRDTSLDCLSQLSLHSRRVSPAATAKDGQQPT